MEREKLKEAIERYAMLEQEILRHQPAEISSACASCADEGKCCCRQEVGVSAVETWWFRTVSLHIHGRWWRDDYEEHDACPAMCEDGCLLVAGRPLICSSFFCEKMMEAATDPWRLTLFAFLSDLPGWALLVGGRKNFSLLETEEEALPFAEPFLERIEEALGLLERASLLTDPKASRQTKQQVTIELFCHNPRAMRPMVRRRLLHLFDGTC